MAPGGIEVGSGGLGKLESGHARATHAVEVGYPVEEQTDVSNEWNDARDVIGWQAVGLKDGERGDRVAQTGENVAPPGGQQRRELLVDDSTYRGFQASDSRR